MLGTETLLFTLDRETANQRFMLRSAYLTGKTVRTALIRRSQPIRVIDYVETIHDNCIEIAISVATAPDDGGSGH